MARGQRTHLLQLGLGRHLLRHGGGLDAVEEAFEPADELGLGVSFKMGRNRRDNRIGYSRESGEACGRDGSH